MDYRKLTIAVWVILLAAGLAGVFASVPDTSRALSGGMQDLAQGVPGWQQVNSSGFGDPLNGEVSALEAFNGYIYAGTFNPIDPTPGQLYDGAQIFRSADGANWNPVTEPGFGNAHDIAPPAILDFVVFNSRLYASTGRGNASQIWRTQNGVIWAPMDLTGFGDPENNFDLTALAVYGGKIYAGVTNQSSGAQIWTSFTGDNGSWEQVAPETPGTAPASVTGFAEFGGALYAAIESESPAQIWQSYGGASGTWVTVAGFGDSSTLWTGGMAEFAGYLYVGAGNETTGAQLWRTNNGETWEQTTSPVFGDPNYQKVEMVFVYQNQLYASVKHAGAGGMEIWRTADGSLWEPANLAGFGDSNNTSTNWSNATAEFVNRLYVGTANAADGGELWRMQVDEADLSVAKVDAVDPVTVGDSITYTLTVSNGGPDPALNVILIDNLPGSVTFGSAVPDQGNCGEAAGIVTCNLGDIASSANVDVVVVLTTTGAGLLTNSASVSSDTVDPNDGDNSTSEDTTVDPAPVPEADLAISMGASPEPVGVGATLTYTLLITNTGPDTATAVTVSDDLPVGATYGGASGDGWLCDQVGGIVTCARGSLSVAVAPTLVLTVTAPASSGTISSTVTVSSELADPYLANNAATAYSQVKATYYVFLPLVSR